MFICSNESGKIRNISVCPEAFHVFVAIYCSKFPAEIGHLMTYAQFVQGISKSSGDDAAIDYDEKFRQWRQVAPGACPWNLKNAELFQDAIVKGLEAKPKYKKQSFRAQQSKAKYCFTFNNKGKCTKGPSCPFPHICQYCSGNHSRLHCKSKSGSTTSQAKPDQFDGTKRTANFSK